MRLRGTKSVVSGRGRLAYDSLVPNVFVDSVNGNDLNNGLTLATAVQTISRAQSLMFNGAVLGLVRGSKWRETFTFQHPNITIVVAGNTADPPPILDGRDVVPATWTQPDPIGLPDVWSISWTRAQAATTGSAFLNLWVDNEFVRVASSLADLQSNGGAHYVSRTATTTTISIRSTTNPNSNGVVYEASTRGWGFRGHSTAIGSAAPVNQRIYGPIELVGYVEHYNAVAGGPGQVRRVLVTDGNIHHITTESDLVEDALMSRVVPGITGSLHTAYRVTGTGFRHTARRCLALTDGGAGRLDHGGFYTHASTPSTTDEFVVDQCIARSAGVSGDTKLLQITNFYGEEGTISTISSSGTNESLIVNRAQIQQLTAKTTGSVNLFRSVGPGTTVVPMTFTNVCGIAHLGSAAGFTLNATSVPAVISHCSIIGRGAGITGNPNTQLTLNNCVVWSPNGRPLDLVVAPYVGNFNVFQFQSSDNQPIFRFNGVTLGTLAAWQTATGQDTHSVWVRNSDQVAGSANAFWLGVATNANAGPADGDWRINPTARVYNSAGATLTGTFADGVTPLTAAGPQEHWNFNTRSVVAGPPTRLLRLPQTKAEERQYINEPSLWNFYP